MRSALVLLAGGAVGLGGCPNMCAEVQCTRSETSIEVPLDASNAEIDGARVDLCRDGLCDRTYVEVPRGPEPPERASVRCPIQPRNGSVACTRKNGGSPIVLAWSGAYGGEVTVRIVARRDDGADDLLAERTGTMVREDYVVDGACADCSQWVMR